MSTDEEERRLAHLVEKIDERRASYDEITEAFQLMGGPILISDGWNKEAEK